MTSRTVFFNIVRFFFLILLQVLILNHVNLGGYVNPLFYVYFILLLPFSVSRGIMLISSFLLGLGVDIFTNTIGLNAASCVIMAFARPFVINSISSGPETLIGDTPSLKNQGIKWFLYYTIILVLIHHTSLFFLEIFRFIEFFKTLLRIGLSSAFTITLILISEYVFIFRQK